MRTRIIIRNKEISQIIQKFAFENYGLWWAQPGMEYIEDINHSIVKYPILFNCSQPEKKLGWDYGDSIDNVGDIRLDASTEFGEVITLLTKPKRPEFIQVKLDDNNVMSVTKNGIRFGGDAFPLSIIDDLVAAKVKVLAK